MKPLTCVFAALFISIFVSSAVQARKTGPYIGILGGITFLSDTDFQGSGIPPDSIVTTSWNNGFHIGGVAGYRFSDYLRLEAELTYRQNNLDTLEASGPGFDSVAQDGDIKTVGFLGNLWVDIDLGQFPVVPYVGGGAGIGGAELQLAPVDLGSSGTFLSNESETAFVFAYQLGAGIGYSFNEHITLSLDYRYFGTTDPDFRLIRKASAAYKTHNVGVSLRYEF